VYKFIGEDEIHWFVPPLTLSLLDEQFGSKFSMQRMAEMYTYEMHDYVAFLVKDPPNIKFRDCLLKALPGISKKIAERYPGSLEPELDLQRSVDHLRFKKRAAVKFMVHNPPVLHDMHFSYPCDFWQGEALDYFEELVYEHCGEADVHIDRYVEPYRTIDGEEPNWFNVILS